MTPTGDGVMCPKCGGHMGRGEFRLYGELVEIIFICANPKCKYTFTMQPLEATDDNRKQAA